MTPPPEFSPNGNHKLAIIDLGSNTTRMLIIEVTANGAYHLVEEDKFVVRLSEGEAKDGEIKMPGLLRAIDAMRLFKGMCEYHGVKDRIAVATAAVRGARNQETFLRKLKEETGIAFRVLSQEEEAYYGYLGVINTTSLADGLIVDLGGGSMELTAIKGRAIAHSTSIPYGALNLTEKFINGEKPSDNKLKDLDAFVKQQLKGVDWLDQYRKSLLYGIGGTIRSIARINQRLSNYPFDELHNYEMSSQVLGSVYNLLKNMTPKELVDVPGLSRDRTDIIVAGTAAINTVIKYLEIPTIRVSSSGLRDGLFFHKFLKEPVVADVSALAIDNISRLYGVDITHARRVCSLVESLFEGFKPLNGFTADHRRILRAAAMLHELGYYYDYGKRFNNTFYNVIDNPVYGFSHLDNYRTALVAASYGAGGIKSRFMFSNVPLGKDDLKEIKRLSLILALADAFDRSRRGRISAVNCLLSKNSAVLKLQYKGDILPEVMSAEERSGNFKKAFDRELIIEY
ncbi:MAG TPA: Ppx/GppA phosphatase family protein [Methanocella sp.]|uniref:Ppx/GppA phosphatase family protein n=1 Tax=Methanocella sp. TaxID=2052833 RepID=UPI002CADB5BD|nr:Ppx/GppA phosphatase family protein [Methanocella sp.]HTY92143.1 Ppx/GppA phosphatase family protein [Methanocella sp.]